MTSFAVTIEPAPLPRLATAALLVHGAAAATPWISRVATPLAVVLSLIAIAGFVLTLRNLPGRHGRLAVCALDERGCRVRLQGSPDFLPAALGPGTRAYPSLVFIDVRAGSRRLGWLLPRASLPPGQFRRLKARIRLSC